MLDFVVVSTVNVYGILTGYMMAEFIAQLSVCNDKISFISNLETPQTCML